MTSSIILSLVPWKKFVHLTRLCPANPIHPINGTKRFVNWKRRFFLSPGLGRRGSGFPGFGKSYRYFWSQRILSLAPSLGTRVCRAREIKELIANIGTIFGSAKFVSVLAFHNFPGAPWPFRFNAKCVYNARGTSKAGITATYLRMTSL